ncbi:hypothetical protein [[Mycoplasma] testudinis]|uniref:hypothetical protein n=1 Tax=[Mycoplasma] testudinis TaxID=33924 RepID=UPI000488720E|nr:hypothetical protein [[Mycoplasma] testudinis]
MNNDDFDEKTNKYDRLHRQRSYYKKLEELISCDFGTLSKENKKAFNNYYANKINLDFLEKVWEWFKALHPSEWSSIFEIYEKLKNLPYNPMIPLEFKKDRIKSFDYRDDFYLFVLNYIVGAYQFYNLNKTEPQQLKWIKECDIDDFIRYEVFPQMFQPLTIKGSLPSIPECDFYYHPLVYWLFLYLNTWENCNLTYKVKDKSEIFFVWNSVFLKQLKVIHLDLSSGYSENAFLSIRRLIEMFVTFWFLMDDPKSFPEYNKFKQWQLDWSSNNTYPQPFENEYKSFSKRAIKTDFLFYGWLLKSEKFLSSKKIIKLKLSDIFDYFKMKNKDSAILANNLERGYKNGNIWTHITDLRLLSNTETIVLYQVFSLIIPIINELYSFQKQYFVRSEIKKNLGQCHKALNTWWGVFNDHFILEQIK